jgi:hypothetical protein
MKIFKHPWITEMDWNFLSQMSLRTVPHVAQLKLNDPKIFCKKQF